LLVCKSTGKYSISILKKVWPTTTTAKKLIDGSNNIKKKMFLTNGCG